METLYDLLGALPRDDAEELRAAFRRAVKGVHPDLNPGDPDAARKFREIVRASEILGDEEQRAAYDHLLALAHREQQQSAVKAVHKAATSVIALVVATGLGLGGYLVFQHSGALSGPLQHLADIATVHPGDFAGLPPTPAGPPQQAVAPEAPAADAKPQTASEPKPAARIEIASAAPDAMPTVVAAPPTEPDKATTAAVGPPLDIAPSDPKVFRERGIFAYRSGDLDGAVAEFDHAIELDPKFSAAYVDRGIVLYRLQKFEQAFADIAQARRIEKQKSAKTAAKKRKPQAAETLAFPFFPRRTARLE